MNAGTRRLTPGIVFLAIALVGSLLFVAYAVNVRDASQIPLLAAGGAAVGIAFIALAAYSLRPSGGPASTAGAAGRSDSPSSAVSPPSSGRSSSPAR